MAQFNLGCMFEEGLSVAQSHMEALQWYIKASDQDYGPALSAMG